jgi:dipeptidyl aminopeptidase/acylaminoacyl peptidase
MIRHVILLLLLTATAFAQGTKADYERALSLDRRTTGKVFRATVTPRWLPGGNAFWYRIDTSPGQSEHVFVDASKGERRDGLNAQSLAELLTRVLGRPVEASALPGETTRESEEAASNSETQITFVNETQQDVNIIWIPGGGGERRTYATLKPGEKHRQHTFVGHRWRVETTSGKRLASFVGQPDEITATIRENANEENGRSVRTDGPPPAPSREWTAFIRDNNVWIRHRDTNDEVQLSTDGKPDDAYREPFHWSPDGAKLIVMQVEPPQEHKVQAVQSSPSDQVQPKVISYDYLKPGDRIAHPRPRLFDIGKRQPIPVSDELFPNPWDVSHPRWAPDNSAFTFLYNQRGHQLQRVIAINAQTGQAKVLIEETSKTFIDYSQKTELRWLEKSGEWLWASERDGWNHLYLGDARTGAIKCQVTRGEWVVRGIESIDEEQRQVWLRVLGKRPGEDPYHLHLARVNLDGSGFTLLTDGDGTHRWQWSPDRRFIVDSWSRVDQPAVTELRAADTGKLVCELERADISQLTATGWQSPERFSARGRDGKTDIHGIIIKPSNFDPSKKYPVIEKIYAGPHGFFVPKTWGREVQTHGLAELGFIVVQIDGMGTNWRSRAFHDVAWKNLKDAGFPDRIAWMKAAAATRPWMDLTRVGIFGGSAGGQNALAALLHYGDFYKAAAADCGCHDNRMDKIWWNEAWMGWPVGPEYADNSNVNHAAKLTGKLLLTVGELDHNVDPASTMQVVNALVKADKDFDLLIVPGSDHGAGERPYPARRRMDFFVRHLIGVEPRSE